MGRGQIFLKTFRASLFNDDLSNEPNFVRIHLARQYLLQAIIQNEISTKKFSGFSSPHYLFCIFWPQYMLSHHENNK